MEFQVENIRQLIQSVIVNYEYFSIFFLFTSNTIYIFILICGYLNAKRLFQNSRIQENRMQTYTDGLKPISLLVPAYNEEVTILDSVYSMLRLSYPIYEVIVINDGSKDSTLERLIKEFEMRAIDYRVPQVIPIQKINGVYRSAKFPKLTVVDKANGGKADALNCGINYSTYPLVCCVDSDSIFDEEGLMKVSIPFFENPDDMVAVGGTIRVVNNAIVDHGKVRKLTIRWNYLLLIQTVEYLRAFLVGRMGWDYINANTIISGAFGLFRKQAIVNVGGYGQNTVGEDLELLLKIHEYYKKNDIPYQVKFLPDPICWTEVPTDFKTLGNQRSRWQQGLAEGLFQSRKMFFRPWSGTVGWFALPYLFIFELLAAPIEFFAYLTSFLGLAFGLIEPHLFLLFMTVSVFYGWLLTFAAIMIEEFTFQKYKTFGDFIKLFLGTILEQIGFRQLHLYFRMRGFYRYLRGYNSWGEMVRKGF